MSIISLTVLLLWILTVSLCVCGLLFPHKYIETERKFLNFFGIKTKERDIRTHKFICVVLLILSIMNIVWYGFIR